MVNYREIFLLVLGSVCSLISMHLNGSYPGASSLTMAKYHSGDKCACVCVRTCMWMQQTTGLSSHSLLKTRPSVTNTSLTSQVSWGLLFPGFECVGMCVCVWSWRMNVFPDCDSKPPFWVTSWAVKKEWNLVSLRDWKLFFFHKRSTCCDGTWGFVHIVCLDVCFSVCAHVHVCWLCFHLCISLYSSNSTVTKAYNTVCVCVWVEGTLFAKRHFLIYYLATLITGEARHLGTHKSS